MAFDIYVLSAAIIVHYNLQIKVIEHSYSLIID